MAVQDGLEDQEDEGETDCLVDQEARESEEMLDCRGDLAREDWLELMASLGLKVRYNI